jgi:nitroimidazol reductase NimA-like FMN-containing flavoprotein (pyridoxamine 5'-phosphate oxidase superfamily)
VETGVLSLARGEEAYAVPLVHYYDGQQLYFRLGRADDTTV